RENQMLLLTKIITSSLMIVLITEVAKRHSVLGGLIAVLPVNILLAMFWLYIERKDIALLGEFSKSALLGLIPLAIFLVLVTLLFKKSQGFTPTIFVGVFALALFAFIQYKFMASM
ncbi:MAG: DUF3147 family protein, partial [Candidatus Gastranaerophilales bacterium]|nr:DUF3147 family protein [Candidatus Gastranaerophilales bacterium]